MGFKTYEARAEITSNAVARKLLNLMARKKTNLCASLDVRTTKEFLSLIEQVGPYIAVVKTHVDIIDDFTYEKTVLPLVELSKKYNFLIFEDRKFADIGSTVKAQYTGGVYKISEWADITNAHSIPGPGIVQGLYEAAQESSKERGLLMLAELSSKGSLAVGEYTQKTVEIARANKQFVFGFIAQRSMPTVDEDEDWLILTPGVGLDDKGDNLGQQYRTVDQAIETGSDMIIVGRGIFGKGRDAVKEAQRYRDAGWAAYEKRVEGSK